MSNALKRANRAWLFVVGFGFFMCALAWALNVFIDHLNK